MRAGPATDRDGAGRTGQPPAPPAAWPADLLRATAANTAALFAAQVFNRLTAFVVAMILTRYLGPERFGEYAFVCAYVGFFILVADMGIDIHVIREASRDLAGSADALGSAIGLKAWLALAAFAGSLLVGWVVGIRGERLGLVAISASGLLIAPLTLYGAAFFATLRLHLSAFLDALGRALLVALVVIVVLCKGSLAAVFVALVLPGYAVAFLTVLWGRKLLRPRIGFFRGRAMRRILARSLPIALGLMLAQIVMRIDQVMLEAMRGSRELGFYSVGVKCCEALNILPAIVTASLFPLLSRAAATPGEDLARIYGAGLRTLALALLPLVMVLSLYPAEILTTVFGPSYADGASALRILCWSAILFAVAHVAGSVAIALGCRGTLVLMTLCMAAANVGLNALLIPRQDALGGGNGAAVATFVALLSCLPILWLRPALRPVARAFAAQSWRPALSAAAALVCVGTVRPPLALGIPLALGLYLAAAVLLKAVDRSDWQRAMRILRPGGVSPSFYG